MEQRPVAPGRDGRLARIIRETASASERMIRSRASRGSLMSLKGDETVVRWIGQARFRWLGGVRLEARRIGLSLSRLVPAS